MTDIAMIDVVVAPGPTISIPFGTQGPPGPPGPAGPPGEPGSDASGDVVGPASATDNALALFDGATGKLLDAGPDGTISGSLTTPVVKAPAATDLKLESPTAAVYFRAGGANPFYATGTSVEAFVPFTSHAALIADASVAVGTNPAQSGAIRLGNNQAITARNAANTADSAVLVVDAGNGVRVSNDGAFTYVHGALVIVPNPVRFQQSLELREIAPPAAPIANAANLWLQDNGSGKTQLMIQFNTGAAIAIATQV